MKTAIYKVPDGKLVKIFLETEGDLISSIKITGDFFIYPEESITMLEQAVTGQPLDAQSLTSALNDVVEQEKLELFGVDSASISKTILMATA